MVDCWSGSKESRSISRIGSCAEAFCLVTEIWVSSSIDMSGASHSSCTLDGVRVVIVCMLGIRYCLSSQSKILSCFGAALGLLVRSSMCGCSLTFTWVVTRCIRRPAHYPVDR